MKQQSPPEGMPGQGQSSAPWHSWFTWVTNAVNSVINSGVTADRPTKILWIGRVYFDTDLGIPIWYNGTVWVDATGATV